MNCYKHNNLGAVARCHDCGKGLCNNCADRFSLMQCEDCILLYNEQVKTSIKRRLMLAIAIFIITIFLYTSEGMLTGLGLYGFFFTLFSAYVWAGIPIAWGWVSKISPDFILILPIGGWILFYLYKILVSALVGIFISPFQLRKMLKELQTVEYVRSDIETREI